MKRVFKTRKQQIAEIDREIYTWDQLLSKGETTIAYHKLQVDILRDRRKKIVARMSKQNQKRYA